MSAHDYHMNDCVLALPRGFADRSLNMLEWQLESGDTVALVVQRDMVGSSTDFDDFVEEETRGYSSQFLGYHLERDDAETPQAGLDLRRKTFRFTRDGDVIYSHQIFILDRPRLLVLTASARARHRRDVDQIVDDALVGLRFRDS